MRVNLAKRVAIVTGSTRGIGHAIALAFASNGAHVVVHGRSAANAERVASEISESSGVRAAACGGDIALASTHDQLVATAVKEFGGLDILVNNAALTNTSGPFLEMTDERIDLVLSVNLRAAVLLARRAVEVMARHRRGVIVNVSSVGGSQRAHTGSAVYDTSKGGLDALTRALAVDLGPLGIRANAVGPAAIVDAPVKGRGQDLPLRRGGTPADVAGAVLYLVSDDAAFLTGQLLFVDGGLSAQLRSPTRAGPWYRPQWTRRSPSR